MKSKLIIAILVLASSSLTSHAQEDLFAGRSGTAGADVASSKENIPVKKETFTSKLDRYKSEGFKVAVVLYSGDITTKQVDPAATQTAGTIGLKGSVPSIKTSLQPLADAFASSMNEAFNTDVFEVVDLKNIPYKESKWGKVDDWGGTKYKMVITYSANPIYDYSLFMDKYKGELTINLGVVGTEFVNEKKGVKMRYPIRTGNLGFYKSPAYETEANPNISTTEELHKLVNPDTGSDLVAELMKQQEEKMPDFIAKRKKK